MGGFEERLERIEKLLVEVIRRLERIEAVAGSGSEEARVAVELATAFALSASDVVAAVARAVGALRRMPSELSGDPIARAIVEALAVNGPLTLRGLEREVRRIRGKASRAAIASRVRRLEGIGIVCVRRMGRRVVVSLAVEDDTGCDSSTRTGRGQGGSTLR